MANRVVWHLSVCPLAHRIQDVTHNLSTRTSLTAGPSEFLLVPHLAFPGRSPVLFLSLLRPAAAVLALWLPADEEMGLSVAAQELTLWVPPRRCVCRRKVPRVPLLTCGALGNEAGRELHLLPGSFFPISQSLSSSVSETWLSPRGVWLRPG